MCGRLERGVFCAFEPRCREAGSRRPQASGRQAPGLRSDDIIAPCGPPPSASARHIGGGVAREVERWREMTDAEKAELVASLTRTALQMMDAGIAGRYPHASKRERFLRRAILTLVPSSPRASILTPQIWLIDGCGRAVGCRQARHRRHRARGGPILDRPLSASSLRSRPPQPRAEIMTDVSRERGPTEAAGSGNVARRTRSHPAAPGRTQPHPAAPSRT